MRPRMLIMSVVLGLALTALSVAVARAEESNDDSSATIKLTINVAPNSAPTTLTVEIQPAPSAAPALVKMRSDAAAAAPSTVRAEVGTDHGSSSVLLAPIHASLPLDWQPGASQSPPGAAPTNVGLGCGPHPAPNTPGCARRVETEAPAPVTAAVEPPPVAAAEAVPAEVVAVAPPAPQAAAAPDPARNPEQLRPAELPRAGGPLPAPVSPGLSALIGLAMIGTGSAVCRRSLASIPGARACQRLMQLLGRLGPRAELTGSAASVAGVRRWAAHQWSVRWRVWPGGSLARHFVRLQQRTGARHDPPHKLEAHDAAAPTTTPGGRTPLSLAAARSKRRADAELARLECRLQAELTTDQWRLCATLLDADRAARFAEQGRFVAELCHHLPGLTPTIRVVAGHIFEPPVAARADPVWSLRDARRGAQRAGTYDVLRQRLRAELTTDQWRLCTALSDADRAARFVEQDRFVAELSRNFPGLAPAIHVVAGHIVDTPIAEQEACCGGVWRDAQDSS
jgi:hypothetical protein